MLSDYRIGIYKGRPVTNQFQELYRSIETYLGSDGASLFAFPEIAFSQNKNADVITWYADLQGTFRSFDVLSQEEQTAAETLLKRQLGVLIERADPATLEMLSVALNILGTESIYYNGEAVVLSGWGLFSDNDQDKAGIYQHALISYLPSGFTLADSAETLSETETEEVVVTTGKSPGPSAGNLASSVASEAAGNKNEPTHSRQTASGESSGETAEPGDGNPKDNPTVLEQRRETIPVIERNGAHSRTSIYWMLGATLFLAFFLFYMMWPGNLLYPETTALLNEQEDLEARRSSNAALEDQIGRLRRALEGDVCTAEDGTYLDQIYGFPLSPESRIISPETTPPVSQDAVPVVPGTVPPAIVDNPENGPAPSTDNSQISPRSELLESLDNGTVFIVGDDVDGVSMGSGILISPRHVLTNYHVIEETSGAKLFIINQHTNGPVQATVIAQSPNSDIATNDFAVLQLAREVRLPRLPIAMSVNRLDGVVAAGYPSFVISSDPNFIAAFDNGDYSRLNTLQLAVTRGVVTAKQAGQSGNTVLAHSATISSGSSGGPLVDICGRIVGINTYVRTDSENALRLNFALSSADAIIFLKLSGIDVIPDTSACRANLSPISPEVPAQIGEQPDGDDDNANPDTSPAPDVVPEEPDSTVLPAEGDSQ